MWTTKLTVGTYIVIVLAACGGEHGGESTGPPDPPPAVWEYEGRWMLGDERIYSTGGSWAACGCRGCPCDPLLSEMTITSTSVRKSCNNIRNNNVITDGALWDDCEFSDFEITCTLDDPLAPKYSLLRIRFTKEVQQADVYEWYSDYIPPQEVCSIALDSAALVLGTWYRAAD